MIEIYTDGACSGNPGPGGFGYVALRDGEEWIDFGKGREENTTNNRMELMALLNAFVWARNIKDKSEIKIYSDSAYAVNSITNWIYSWRKNEWMNSKKKQVENIDLMKMLSDEIDINDESHIWKLYHIKGHANNPGNEIADALARGGNLDELTNLVYKYNIQIPYWPSVKMENLLKNFDF